MVARVFAVAITVAWATMVARVKALRKAALPGFVLIVAAGLIAAFVF